MSTLIITSYVLEMSNISYNWPGFCGHVGRLMNRPSPTFIFSYERLLKTLNIAAFASLKSCVVIFIISYKNTGAL